MNDGRYYGQPPVRQQYDDGQTAAAYQNSRSDSMQLPFPSQSQQIPSADNGYGQSADNGYGQTEFQYSSYEGPETMDAPYPNSPYRISQYDAGDTYQETRDYRNYDSGNDVNDGYGNEYPIGNMEYPVATMTENPVPTGVYNPYPSDTTYQYDHTRHNDDYQGMDMGMSPYGNQYGYNASSSDVSPSYDGTGYGQYRTDQVGNQYTGYADEGYQQTPNTVDDVYSNDTAYSYESSAPSASTGLMSSSSPVWNEMDGGDINDAGMMDDQRRQMVQSSNLKELSDRRNEHYIGSEWIQGQTDNIDTSESQAKVKDDGIISSTLNQLSSKERIIAGIGITVIAGILGIIGYYMNFMVLIILSIFGYIAIMEKLVSSFKELRVMKHAIGDGTVGVGLSTVFNMLDADYVLMDNSKKRVKKTITVSNGDDKDHDERDDYELVYRTPIRCILWRPKHDDVIREWKLWWSPANTGGNSGLFRKAKVTGECLFPLYVQTKNDMCRFVVDERYVMLKEWLDGNLMNSTSIVTAFISLLTSIERSKRIDKVLVENGMMPLVTDNDVPSDPYLRYNNDMNDSITLIGTGYGNPHGPVDMLSGTTN